MPSRKCPSKVADSHETIDSGRKAGADLGISPDGRVSFAKGNTQSGGSQMKK